MPRQGFGIGVILVGAVFVGLMPNAAKIAYQEGANPLGVITIRCILGMIGLGLFLAIRGQFRFNWQIFRGSALTGSAQALSSIGMLGAVAYIDVSLAILIIFIHPVLIAVVGHFTGENRLTVPLVVCIAFAMAGLILVLTVDFANLNPIGIGLALLGAIALTFLVFLVVSASRQVGPAAANFYMTAWASLCFIVVATIGPALGLIDAAAVPETLRGWIALLSTGFSFTMGYLLFFIGAAIIGTTRASMLSIIEPVLTILFAILLVNEWLTAVQWLGVAIVVTCLFVMELPQRTRRQKV